MTKEKKRRPLRTIIIALFLIIACICVGIFQLGKSGPSGTATEGTPMYVCGYDRCKDSGEYGKLIFETGINVWNNPDPERGGVRRTLDHGDKVRVIEEKRVNEGPGGLWYKLEGGGWISDFWLHENQCRAGNLYPFADCLGGTY